MTTQDLIDHIEQMDCDLSYYKRQDEDVYHALGLLGEALGHPRVASPLSPSALLRQYIEEVRALRARTDAPQSDAAQRDADIKGSLPYSRCLCPGCARWVVAGSVHVCE